MDSPSKIEKVITFRLSEDLYHEVKALADRMNISMNRLLTKTIIDVVVGADG